MTKIVKKARPAEKHSVQANWKQKGLSKVEGILTSSLQLKGASTNQPYYYGFFQLEGIEQDIPVIFKIDSSSEPTPPPIPPRAKIRLEGKWADLRNSPASNRPSFTCLAFQVIANPPPPTVKDLREQISQLLSTSLDKKTEWQQRTDYLFKKKRDLEQWDQLTHLGEKYLSAYLLLRRAYYSNYQDNLLPHNQFNQEEYLTKLQVEIEEVAQQVRAYQSKEKDLF